MKKSTLLVLLLSQFLVSEANAFGRDKKEPPKQTPAPVEKVQPAPSPVAAETKETAPSKPKSITESPAAKVEVIKPSPIVTKPVDPVNTKADIEAKNKARAESAEKARLAKEQKREKDTLNWIMAHPINHFQCGEKTAWSRISASGYTKENAPSSIRTAQESQLEACQDEINKLRAQQAASQNSQAKEPAKTTSDQVTDAATTAKDKAGALFDSFKSSIKNGATQPSCTPAAQAMGQCH